MSSGFAVCALFFWCCLTSTEARWPIRDGDRVRTPSRESEGSTAETVRKKTGETVDRSQNNGSHWAIAVCTVLFQLLCRVTKTMSVALLLTNNLDNLNQKTSNLLSPTPPPYSWSLLGKWESPPPSSKISWSLDIFNHPLCHTRSKALELSKKMDCIVIPWSNDVHRSLIDWLMITYIALFSALLSRLTVLEEYKVPLKKMGGMSSDMPF